MYSKGAIIVERIINLKLYKQRGIFSRAFEYRESGDLNLLAVKNRKSALKKAIRRFKNDNILIAQQDTGQKILKDRMKIYEEISCEDICSIINPLCRKTAEKFNLRLPLEEVLLVAPPIIACSMISSLCGISRLFTIVSEQESMINLFDELYFNKGVVVRQIPGFTHGKLKDSIIIKTHEKLCLLPNTVPVVDMSFSPAVGSNIIQVKNISVFDASVAAVQKIWGGTAGVSLYRLLNKKPGENAEININKRADKIFLLDTEKF